MDKFQPQEGDVLWGFDKYHMLPVTEDQKKVLDAIWFLLSGLPKHREFAITYLPHGCAYFQDEITGTVIIGLHRKFVHVTRSGEITYEDRGE